MPAPATRLLDAALTLFARHGYAATSVADIQQACGLSPGSGALYKHFPSKKALLQGGGRGATWSRWCPCGTSTTGPGL